VVTFIAGEQKQANRCSIFGIAEQGNQVCPKKKTPAQLRLIQKRSPTMWENENQTSRCSILSIAR
jgi:hypothetical protein